MSCPSPSLALLLLPLALCACGNHDDAKQEHAAPPPTAPVEPPPQGEPSLPNISAGEIATGAPVDLGDGLMLSIDQIGNGPAAHTGSTISLRYNARIKDAEANTLIASTDGWDTPLVRVLGSSSEPKLLPALERALLGLRKGTKARIEVPPALGYGKNGPAGTADKTLIFEVELVGVEG